VSDNQEKPRPEAEAEADAQLEREIRKDRKFNLAEAIGRMAGPGAMKGASPATFKQQAEAEIQSWLQDHLTDPEGALQVVLLRDVSRSELLLRDLERPLAVLKEYCAQVLASDFRLKELVRDTDTQWGHQFGERPHFDKEGTPPDPDDPYTVESVRGNVAAIVELLKSSGT
jgi:hypothetical protein